MTAENGTKYSLKISSDYQVRVGDCDADFSKVGLRRNETTGTIPASIWRMNCGRCKVLEVFEVGKEAKLLAELRSVSDAYCGKNIQDDSDPLTQEQTPKL